jgi:hypothetical protein
LWGPQSTALKFMGKGRRLHASRQALCGEGSALLEGHLRHDSGTKPTNQDRDSAREVEGL